MSDRPILFSPSMVRALIDGRKTETRRLGATRIVAGDRLWVRESFRLEQGFDDAPPAALAATAYTSLCVWFEADCGAPVKETMSEWGRPFGRLRPGIHMPRWASRLTLDVVAVRTERLQDITAADVAAEGAWPSERRGDATDPIQAFKRLWDQLNARRAPWAMNPLVSVIQFTPRLEAIGPKQEVSAA